MKRMIRKVSWWPWLGLGMLLAGVLSSVLRPGASAQLPQPDPQPVITFSTGNYTVGEADDSVTITVTLSAPSAQ
ncbi:MAG: hypothetical protein NZM31_04685, partial [Gemmatales bacterium]|nr:hypothetical protein [Gemmatales bacterium]MDW8386297.1 hypothetical protein [Gemmatales bacterium]